MRMEMTGVWGSVGLDSNPGSCACCAELWGFSIVCGEHLAVRAHTDRVNNDGAWPNPLISQRRKQEASAEMTCHRP